MLKILFLGVVLFCSNVFAETSITVNGDATVEVNGNPNIIINKITSPDFNGALVTANGMSFDPYFSSNNQPVTALISFTTSIYDTNGWFDLTQTPDKLTVPDNVEKVKVCFQFATTPSGNLGMTWFHFNLVKNGNVDFREGNFLLPIQQIVGTGPNNVSTSGPACSAIIPVTAGDTFSIEMKAVATALGSLAGQGLWFSIQSF